MIKNKEIINFLRKWILVIIIFFIFIFLFFYYIYIGVLSFGSLIWSIFIFLFISFYKWMFEVLILEKTYSVIINKIYEKLDEYVLKKNKWLIKPIYYILYYFPTNWPYLIVLWIGRKWWDIRLYINSNKDIIGKKYFNKDLSKWVPFFHKSWLKKNVINVFLRIFFLPLYFKLSLLTKTWSVFFFKNIWNNI